MTPDSSVLVAAFASWHERHVAAVTATVAVDALVSHAELEAYSVLTRLPAPHRAPADLASAYLTRQYGGRRLSLPGDARRKLIPRLADLGIAGGAAYDALIAITAATHDLTLLTCDRRAVRIYERIGVRYTAV